MKSMNFDYQIIYEIMFKVLTKIPFKILKLIKTHYLTLKNSKSPISWNSIGKVFQLKINEFLIKNQEINSTKIPLKL